MFAINGPDAAAVIVLTLTQPRLQNIRERG